MLTKLENCARNCANLRTTHFAQVVPPHRGELRKGGRRDDRRITEKGRNTHGPMAPRRRFAPTMAWSEKTRVGGIGGSTGEKEAHGCDGGSLTARHGTGARTQHPYASFRDHDGAGHRRLQFHRNNCTPTTQASCPPTIARCTVEGNAHRRKRRFQCPMLNNRLLSLALRLRVPS